MSQSPPKLTHDWIWQAIDMLADRKGLTPSALAKLAGLDPTAFNKSKRFTQEGRPRWPSTESISKVLLATNTSLDEFAELTLEQSSQGRAPRTESFPILGEVRSARVSGLEALPASQWAEGTAAANDSGAFAIAVADESLEPVYSRGNTLIISTREVVNPGDRVIIKPAGWSPLPRLLVKAGAAQIEVAPFGTEQQKLKIERNAIEWMARIVWARQ